MNPKNFPTDVTGLYILSKISRLIHNLPNPCGFYVIVIGYFKSFYPKYIPAGIPNKNEVKDLIVYYEFCNYEYIEYKNYKYKSFKKLKKIKEKNNSQFLNIVFPKKVQI